MAERLRIRKAEPEGVRQAPESGPEEGREEIRVMQEGIRPVVRPVDRRWRELDAGQSTGWDSTSADRFTH
jgi:hypothetical protein